MADDTNVDDPFESALAEFKAAFDDLANCPDSPVRAGGKEFLAELLVSLPQWSDRRKALN